MKNISLEDLLTLIASRVDGLENTSIQQMLRIASDRVGMVGDLPKSFDTYMEVLYEKVEKLPTLDRMEKAD